MGLLELAAGRRLLEVEDCPSSIVSAVSVRLPHGHIMGNRREQSYGSRAETCIQVLGLITGWGFPRQHGEFDSAIAHWKRADLTIAQELGGLDTRMLCGMKSAAISVLAMTVFPHVSTCPLFECRDPSSLGER